jgi:D-glycero-beta-D-manno-heptose 1-phosphate adenylyltransferase
VGSVAALRDVARAVARARRAKKKVALANGVFDVIHVGHIRYLKDARSGADLLVVAVNSDASARALKGEGRPAVPAGERAEIIASLECVDYVVIFNELDVRKVIRALKPDLQVKGTDYSPATVPERGIVEALGGRVIIAGDPKDHSSTDLIDRIRKTNSRRKRFSRAR